jgi:hypothetical protein
VLVALFIVVLCSCRPARPDEPVAAPPATPVSVRTAHATTILVPRLTPYESDPQYGKVAPSIANPNYDRLVDPTQVVLRADRATLVIHYPLARPARFEMLPDGADGSFTVGGLVRAVAQRYAQVYDEEAKTSSKPAGKMPGLSNRNATDGKYGIWGHDLSDLVLEGMDIERDEQGQAIVELHVGS